MNHSLAWHVGARAPTNSARQQWWSWAADFIRYWRLSIISDAQQLTLCLEHTEFRPSFSFWLLVTGSVRVKSHWYLPPKSKFPFPSYSSSASVIMYFRRRLSHAVSFFPWFMFPHCFFHYNQPEENCRLAIAKCISDSEVSLPGLWMARPIMQLSRVKTETETWLWHLESATACQWGFAHFPPTF